MENYFKIKDIISSLQASEGAGKHLDMFCYAAVWIEESLIANSTRTDLLEE